MHGNALKSGVFTTCVAVGVADPLEVGPVHPATRSAAAQSATSARTANLFLLIPIPCD
jgi:hypothetical protein